jgi:glycerol-3-phosphate dehydrogenase (NAD(P)+)
MKGMKYMKDKKVIVIGDGGWGTALALMLLKNGHAVTLWGPFQDYLDEMAAAKENVRYLPEIPLPDELIFSSDPAAAVNADAVVIVVPSKFYGSVLESFKDYIPANALVVSATKGIDASDGVHFRRMSEQAGEILERDDIAVLSGPSHAEEVARNVPSAVTIAHKDHNLAEQLQQLFANDSFRAYTSDDVIGVELGGALKNVIAIAAGVSDGLGFGDNTKAALVTRGLAEMTRIGTAMGARPETFSGLSGMGDLIVTCGSRLSRNRAVGERLGKGESINDIRKSMQQVAEGVDNCAAARNAAEHFNVEVPITRQVCAIIHEGKDPREAVQELLTRELKREG